MHTLNDIIIDGGHLVLHRLFLLSSPCDFCVRLLVMDYGGTYLRFNPSYILTIKKQHYETFNLLSLSSLLSVFLSL